MMFTTAARHEQSHQFSYPLQAPSHDTSYTYVTAPTSTGTQRHGHDKCLGEKIPQGGFQKPLQYAHPLRNPSAGRKPLSLLDPQMSRAIRSEHMLRRKTPNGTLAAGYDGTPVEWTTTPHAHKHILMPVSDIRMNPLRNSTGFGDRPDEQQDTLSPKVQRTEAPSYQAWQSNVVSPPERYGLGVALDGDLGNNQWRQSGPHTPSLDSVLHQAPMPQHLYNMGGFQQLPTMLQPMWPPCVGPTASNAPGPYGPYWPNGSFEPYRPAALRDQRFHTQFANFSLNDPADPATTSDACGQWLNNSNLGPKRQDSNQPSQWFLPGHLDQSADTYRPFRDQHTVQRQDLDSLRYEADQFQPTVSSHHGRPIPVRHPMLKEDAISWASLPSPAQTLSPLPPEGPRYRDQLQFKEKVLVWAHRIYISLLASIHHSRKHGQHRQHPTERRQSQTNIFPKPPRRSSSMSRSVGPVSTREVQDFTEMHQERISTRFLKISSDQAEIDAKYKFTECTDFQWPPMTPNNGQNEQYSRGSRILGRPQGHFSPHYADNYNSPGHGVPSFDFDPQHNRPTTDAKAAFEMLARLSRESEWKWIDGLLLGGCLAYGLGDYDKALHWYAKVLAIDGK